MRKTEEKKRRKRREKYNQIGTKKFWWTSQAYKCPKELNSPFWIGTKFWSTIDGHVIFIVITRF